MEDSIGRYQYLPTVGDPKGPAGLLVWEVASGGKKGARPLLRREFRTLVANINVYRSLGVRRGPQTCGVGAFRRGKGGIRGEMIFGQYYAGNGGLYW